MWGRLATCGPIVNRASLSGKLASADYQSARRLPTCPTAAAFAATNNEVSLAGAAMNQDMASMRSLLKQHVDVNAPEADGATALHWAAHFDDLEAVDLLIAAGADVKVTNRYGVTPPVEKLLKAGADSNSTVEEGATALMTAARSGNVDVVKSLLAPGAKVNPKEGWRGQTALMWAVAEDHPEVVKLLIEHGADVNARSDTFDFTKLLSARRLHAVDVCGPPRGHRVRSNPGGIRGRFESGGLSAG